MGVNVIARRCRVLGVKPDKSAGPAITAPHKVKHRTKVASIATSKRNVVPWREMRAPAVMLWLE